MSPPRRSKSGLNFRPWINAEARRAVANYAKRTSPSSGNLKSPKTIKSLVRLRSRAHRTVGAARQYNALTFQRNKARVLKMMKAVANYEARRRHKLVRQPSGSFSLARRN